MATTARAVPMPRNAQLPAVDVILFKTLRFLLPDLARELR